uniref:Uncharacterized protein n=1 Tax=Siphoviridae sp. ctYaH2 TaxID=2825549 RepID=A0A8S5V555_9CAUD|nr:MAG TPA: hypothetical protein [Siphoviridae sp. ctYaH2]
MKINGSCLRFAKYTLCMVTSMLADYKHSSLFTYSATPAR